MKWQQLWKVLITFSQNCSEARNTCWTSLDLAHIEDRMVYWEMRCIFRGCKLNVTAPSDNERSKVWRLTLERGNVWHHCLKTDKWLICYHNGCIGLIYPKRLTSVFNNDKNPCLCCFRSSFAHSLGTWRCHLLCDSLKLHWLFPL